MSHHAQLPVPLLILKQSHTKLPSCPGWPWTCSDLSASASGVLWLQACTILDLLFWILRWDLAKLSRLGVNLVSSHFSLSILQVIATTSGSFLYIYISKTWLTCSLCLIVSSMNCFRFSPYMTVLTVDRDGFYFIFSYGGFLSFLLFLHAFLG